MKKILILMTVVILTVSMSDKKGVSIFTYGKTMKLFLKIVLSTK